MRLLVLVLVLVLLSRSTSSSSTPFKLHLLEDAAKSTGAVCLDGSPGAFYLRPGSGSGATKYYIHHQGGGWCESLADCLGRSKGGLGSSKGYGPTMTNDVGYFSQDPSVNPMMYNWNSIHMNYCDGASFSGNNESVTTYQGTKLYSRGSRIREAVFEALAEDLASATDVVISGCSAGGLATYLHTDQWCDAIHAVNPSAKCVGMPDSGFFLDYQNPSVAPTPPPAAAPADRRALNTIPGDYHRGLQWVYEFSNATAGINADCVAAHQSGEHDAWKCMFAEHTSPFIHTPIFVLQSEYDAWQTGHVLAPDDDVNQLGINITARLRANLFDVHPESGGFVDSCHHHCGAWGSISIDGDLVAEAFQKWYSTLGTAGAKKVWAQMQTYPCEACCSPTAKPVCSDTEYCCPDAKHCLQPTTTSCKAGDPPCPSGQVCCPITELCVTAAANCTSPCRDAGSYCCPDALHCLTPTNPGVLCDPSKGASACADGEVCCPVTKLCVTVGEPCRPPLDVPAWARS